METLSVTWVIDGLLGLGLLWLAWQTIASADLFRAIVFFIAFGLLVALAWVQLQAPDVALAEASIGAGLTGALLLSALARLRVTTRHHQPVASNGLMPWLSALILLAAFALLTYVVTGIETGHTGLYADVHENLNTSGVTNPVTAVLLNYRGYDTLLELVVLLLALLAVWSFEGTFIQSPSSAGVVLETLTGLLAPVLVLVAAYLLWVGAFAPGGAFQAGSVLAAGGVLLIVTGYPLRPQLAGWPLRLAMIAGPGAFVAMATVLYMVEGHLLQFPPDYAGVLILIIEACATLSIGITLAALFFGAPPDSGTKS